MKRYFILVLLLSSVGILCAQDIAVPKKSNLNRWRFGGGLGLSLGGHSTAIHIAPSVGYLFTSKLEVGGSLGYTYNKYNDYKFNVFTSGIFSNYQVIPEAFARINYEHHIGKQKYNNLSTSFNENSLWIGGGYQSGGKVGFQVGMMYNLLHDKNNSIYSSPWRPFAGVSFSF